MARAVASALDFSTLGEPEVAQDFVPRASGAAPVPEAVTHAVRKSLTDGVALQFTVPADDVKHANVSTLVGFLRRAAEADKRGLSVKTAEVKNRAGTTTHVHVKFKTSAERIKGRGRPAGSRNEVTVTQAPEQETPADA